jgi:hypothetical protein
VLRKLAGTLKLKLNVDEAALQKAKLSLENGITVDVVEVELDALLEAIGESAGLSVKASDTDLLVAPR